MCKFLAGCARITIALDFQPVDAGVQGQPGAGYLKGPLRISSVPCGQMRVDGDGTSVDRIGIAGQTPGVGGRSVQTIRQTQTARCRQFRRYLTEYTGNTINSELLDGVYRTLRYKTVQHLIDHGIKLFG